MNWPPAVLREIFFFWFAARFYGDTDRRQLQHAGVIRAD
jgi:hypothetical protein